MTVILSTTQVQERLTVTLTCTSAASLPSAIIVVDGKAYTGLWTPGTLYTFTHTLALERGPHAIYAQATDSAGTVTTSPITFVMAYELTTYGIDLYSGDAKLDVISPVIHDVLLPDLPTLTFSCATLLTGSIGAVIRERGLRQYQCTIDTTNKSGIVYQYVCKAAESYALTSAIMALQTSYGSTSDAIKLLVPSLNIVDENGLLEQTTYPQMFSRITPVEIIKQLMIQALAQASVRNGNLYVFPQDIGGNKVTFSADIKSAVAGNVYFYALGKYEINASIVVAATTTYQRVTMTGFFTYNPQGYNGDVCSLSFYGGYGSGVIPTVKNVEIDVDGVPVLISATEFTGSPSEYCLKDITAIAQQNMLPPGYRDPDYHMQRLDPLTGWQRDDNVYDSVQAHYVVKQYPTPSTVLTLNDKANWKDANGANVLVYDVTQVSDSLLPVPSGAVGMLKSVGNCSRENLSVLFKYFDRLCFNWNPVTASSLTISLQQDAGNKLEITHAFAGQVGSGFLLNTGAAPTDIITKSITLSPTQHVKVVSGTTTANCSYRVTLLDAGSGVIWQDQWYSTISNTFESVVPPTISQANLVTTVTIEVKDLYLVDGVHYGVQCIQCYIQVQTWTAVGSHDSIVSSTNMTVAMQFSGSDWGNGPVQTLLFVVPTLTGSQWYEVLPQSPYPWVQFYINFPPVTAMPRANAGWGLITAGSYVYWYYNAGYGGDIKYLFYVGSIKAALVIHEYVSDFAWVSSYFTWSSPINWFEAVNLPLVNFTKTGNPVTLQKIALTFTDDNYIDTLYLMADNPLPITVQSGAGSRTFIVPDDFGSEAGAQAYADGLLPIISVPREQYTRDVPHSVDLGVGATVDCDGTPMTVYSADYRQEGKTLAAGKAMDTLQTRLAEQSRQIDTLKRKV